MITQSTQLVRKELFAQLGIDPKSRVCTMPKKGYKWECNKDQVVLKDYSASKGLLMELRSSPFGYEVKTRLRGFKQHSMAEIPRWDGVSYALSPRAVTKIYKTARFLDLFQAKPNFVTLTFKEARIPHHEAKKRLNTWLTYVRQLNKNFHYLWVAELHTGKAEKVGRKSKASHKGTIHFHILTNIYIGSKEARAWRDVNGRIGYERVKGNAAGYMSKYMSKTAKEGKMIDYIIGRRFGMSQKTAKAIEGQLIDYCVLPTVYTSDTINYFSQYEDVPKVGCTRKIEKILSIDNAFDIWFDVQDLFGYYEKPPIYLHSELTTNFN